MPARACWFESSRGHRNFKTTSIPAWEEGPLRLNKSDILCEVWKGLFLLRRAALVTRTTWQVGSWKLAPRWLFEKCLRLFQVWRVKPFCEPAVYPCEELSGFFSLALLTSPFHQKRLDLVYRRE